MHRISFMIEALFWIGIFLIFYTYIGYGILLYAIVKIKKILRPVKSIHDTAFEPEVSFIVPCYNEAEFIEMKVRNCLALDYPADKLKLIFITDGSTDGTPEIIMEKFPQVTVLHEARRAGKSAAENRSMKFVKTPIAVFSDANTTLPSNAVKELVKHYSDPRVGAVSGEKRILKRDMDNATGAGEGAYWKYESLLKKLDAELLTIVGAAGELFSFRTELFSELEEDTILDDFMLSLRIAQKNYRVLYEPNAYAIEMASASVKEEMKRKIRICAGGWQSMVRLRALLNPMNNPVLTFQYFSHRVLRWSAAPLFLFLLIPLNAMLFYEGLIYQFTLYGQGIFYVCSMMGWYLENYHTRNKLLFIPYYFFMMNYAVYIGFYRYLRGKQAAAWERAKRGVAVS